MLAVCALKFKVAWHPFVCSLQEIAAEKKVKATQDEDDTDQEMTLSCNASVLTILGVFLKLSVLLAVGAVIFYIDAHDAGTTDSHGEEVDVGTAIYFAVITATTIGYGDFSPSVSSKRKVVNSDGPSAVLTHIFN